MIKDAPTTFIEEPESGRCVKSDPAWNWAVREPALSSSHQLIKDGLEH